MSIFKIIINHLFRKKEVLQEPSKYPDANCIDAWMEEKVRYFQVMYPDQLFTLFDPTYLDYLPRSVQVATSSAIFHQNHLQHYREIKERFPEELKKRGGGSWKYLEGDPDDNKLY